jgi:hypothetical protein
MRLGWLSTLFLTTALWSAGAAAQANPREQLRVYNQQADPLSRERDWREYRKYDHDRLESGQRAYYANRYYRDGRFYEARLLGPDDRIYRGRNDQYYCRRPDGTTGLIERGLAGRISQDMLDRGASVILADLANTRGGSALALAVDRQEVVCR